MVDQFVAPIPDKFANDPELAEYFRTIGLLLDDLTRPEGAIATSTATTEVVLTQQEKLDLIAVTQDVDLDDMESKINKVATSSPDYGISNDGTVRTINADDAAGAISLNPTQAEVENIRDAVLVMADVLATVIRDLKDKDVFSV